MFINPLLNKAESHVEAAFLAARWICAIVRRWHSGIAAAQLVITAPTRCYHGCIRAGTARQLWPGASIRSRQLERIYDLCCAYGVDQSGTEHQIVVPLYDCVHLTTPNLLRQGRGPSNVRLQRY